MKIKLGIILATLVLGLGIVANNVYANNFPFPLITICHVPSNPDEIRQVPFPALLGHLRHGDYLGPCVIESPIPSPSPEASPSPEPSPVPCEETEEGCPPSPESSVEPTLVPLTQGAEGCSQDCHPTYNPPTCNGIYADKPVITGVGRIGSTEVVVNWATNNADKIDISYGYVGGDLEFGATGLSGNARQLNIGNLQTDTPVNIQVIAWRGNCSVVSEVVDP